MVDYLFNNHCLTLAYCPDMPINTEDAHRDAHPLLLNFWYLCGLAKKIS